MALLGNFTKQPAEVLDFDISYTTVLLGRSDVIVAKDVTVTPSGLVIEASTINGTNNGIKVVVSGGTDAITYTVTVKATSDATPALIYEDEVTVIVEEV